MNLGQIDAYGYIPHTPAGLYHAPPTRKGECDQGSFLRLLPDRELAAKHVGPAWVLARPTRRPITSFARDILATLSPVHRAAAERLQEALRDVSLTIAERNRHRFMPYTYLDAAHMAFRISI